MDLFDNNKEKVKPAHVASSTGNNEWYTPEKFIEAARLVMGGIDTDPASSEIANKLIRADNYYTESDNGLTKIWRGRMWMNPPFAQPLVKQFCEKAVHHYDSGELSQACVLVNNGTETKHGQLLLKSCDAVCFPASRIRFIAPDAVTKNAPLQGQMITYFGDNGSEFERVFSEFGASIKVVPHV